MKHQISQKIVSGKRCLYFIVVTVICVIAPLYFFFDPAISDFFPQCPFHTLTGLDCPGCGSQRALHRLLHGDILEAADHNILLVTAIPLLAAWLYGNVARSYSAPAPVWSGIVDQKLGRILVFSIILAFGILRNLPYDMCRFLAA